MAKGIIALDADGVLLDYSLAYATAWERAFGAYPQEKDPHAYWPMDRWGIERLTGDRLEEFRAVFDHEFWSTVPAIEGAVEACQRLQTEGYELVCVTAVRQQYLEARKSNLRSLGFPIEIVHATEHSEGDRSPKADVLDLLRPVAFVDDFLPYLAGVHPEIHAALILRGPNGSPNAVAHARQPDSLHGNLAQFADWWLARLGGNVALQSKA